jgi:hypothetical protein
VSKKERFKRLSELGCIVCKVHYGIFTPCHIHHLTGIKYRSTGKKASYEHTIGLCPQHHQYGDNENPSIHARPVQFAEKFGSQEILLARTKDLI